MDENQPAVESPESPLYIDHGERVTETVVDDGKSELERHNESRKSAEPPPLPEATATEGEQPPVQEPKKPDRWEDPDTGDHYDMRHKVARRIKAVLEDRGKERSRADAAERRISELTQQLIARGSTPADAKAEAKATVGVDPEPNPADTETYPEGQFDPKFMKDMGRWAARQETTEQFGKARSASQQQAYEAAEHQAVTQWQTTLPEARKRYENFDSVLESFPNTPQNQGLTRVMLGSPVGNDVVYVIGTQPELRKAYDAAPNQDARMRLIYHVEAQLIQAQRAAGKTKPPAKTTAPPPVEPVNTGGGAPNAVDWSRTDDTDQYQRWKSQRQARR
jgi:hypothetical protein